MKSSQVHGARASRRNGGWHGWSMEEAQRAVEILQRREQLGKAAPNEG